MSIHFLFREALQLMGWWLSDKESTCQAGDMDSIPRSGSSPEKEMATHSSILTWEIPWTEEPGSLSPLGCKRVGQDLVTKQQLLLIDVEEMIEICNYY